MLLKCICWGRLHSWDFSVALKELFGWPLGLVPVRNTSQDKLILQTGWSPTAVCVALFEHSLIPHLGRNIVVRVGGCGGLSRSLLHRIAGPRVKNRTELFSYVSNNSSLRVVSILQLPNFFSVCVCVCAWTRNWIESRSLFKLFWKVMTSLSAWTHFVHAYLVLPDRNGVGLVRTKSNTLITYLINIFTLVDNFMDRLKLLMNY